ncbi:Cof-type HAD-IIB family hydrolase [Lactococcus taiwanensis]|uniref:Cof-type HAD-IIB family hydrolase n=1 Tax=Lactococcus taiwanensis TaxID=1151742 RepID=UPI0028AFE076|nr:Cof-type HAD-IIB family hydrolase [Lactococcus taiwanensis]
MTKQLKLFATDMDGTFLRNDHSYNHKKLAELIPQIQAKGLLFAASSGRSLLGLTQVFSEYKDHMAFVAENGGVVAYQGKILFAKDLSIAQTQELIDALQEMPYSPKQDYLISGLKGAYYPEGISEDYLKHAKLYYPNCQLYHDLADIDDKLLKITTDFPDQHVRDCEQWVTNRLPFIRATTTGFTSIDIVPAGISKASGLAHLLAHFNWLPEKLAVFGDQMNDFEMLEYAGAAYAVSNAAPEILAIADKVILSNDEDAVLLEIEKILEEV